MQTTEEALQIARKHADGLAAALRHLEHLEQSEEAPAMLTIEQILHEFKSGRSLHTTH